MLQFLMAGHSGPTILFVLFSAFVAGLARGFSGFGAALIFVPLASSMIGPRLAAPLLLIIDTVAALGLLPGAWPKADKRSVAVMAAGGLLGVPLGTSILVLVDPLLVRWFVEAVVALLLALLMSGWRYHGRPAIPMTIGVGIVSGAFSGAIGAGGPPVIAYWLGGKSPAAIVRANIVVYFAVSTVFTIASYLIGGLLVRELVPLCLVTGPVYALALYAGSHLFGRANEAAFRRIAYALIAAAAIISLPVLDPVLR